jgi:hypothetical protein
MFERKHEKLLPRRAFLRRVTKYASISLGLVVVSLLIGMLGYHSLKECLGLTPFSTLQ